MNNINSTLSIDNNIIQKNNNFEIKNESNPLDLQKNFLSLLIAQIKNQDPTDPIKNTELTSQLAQINTANGIEKLNNTAGKFSNKINQHQNIQMSSLIGHHVMIPKNYIIHTKKYQTKFGIELIGNATLVQIKIIDKNGKILYFKELKNAKAGIYNFTWNGKDLNKNIVDDGQYNISVLAKNNNRDVPVESLSSAFVYSIIASSSENPMIDLGTMGNVTLSKIREILK